MQLIFDYHYQLHVYTEERGGGQSNINQFTRPLDINQYLNDLTFSQTCVFEIKFIF